MTISSPFRWCIGMLGTILSFSFAASSTYALDSRSQLMVYSGLPLTTVIESTQHVLHIYSAYFSASESSHCFRSHLPLHFPNYNPTPNLRASVYEKFWMG